MSTVENLKLELAYHSQRGITFIMAASVYWACLGLAGIFFDPRVAFTISIWGTGILFPISILLAKLMRINIFFKNDLSPMGIWANVFQLFLFPVFFISAKANIYFPPIFMGVLAGAHFVFYHWLYKSKTYLALAFIISISSYILGYLYLEKSYSVIGLSNAGWLMLGSVGLAFENINQSTSTPQVINN
ncbi:MAG: DUF7010 family protein [Cyclobacteriaceae bacterium]